MNEESRELFNNSKRVTLFLSSIESSAFNRACRNGCANAKEKIVDMDSLRQAVEDGSVWEWYMTGEKMIEIYCEWISGERPLPKSVKVGKLVQTETD